MSTPGLALYSGAVWCAHVVKCDVALYCALMGGVVCGMVQHTYVTPMQHPSKPHLGHQCK